MTIESGSRLLTALGFPLLLFLALGMLIGGAFIASRFDGLLRLICGLAGFGGYIVLFAAALRRLPVDWNMWRDRGLEGFRSKSERPAAGRRRAT